MVYDCFPFFNELDLLEIRLHELNDVVDKFVLVEAAYTFQNTPKPFYFEENKERFQEFLEKIIHIKIDRFPRFIWKKLRKPNAWDIDNYQKDQIALALNDCKPDDILIIGDLDEIPKASKITEYKDAPGVKIFQQLLTYYTVNGACIKSPDQPSLAKKDGLVYWKGTVMLPYKDFTTFRVARIQRDNLENKLFEIEKGGWHFSFIGGAKEMLYKLKSWTHTKEVPHLIEKYEDLEVLQKVIDEGGDLFENGFGYKYLPLDNTFPKYLIENQDKYPRLIKEVTP